MNINYLIYSMIANCVLLFVLLSPNLVMLIHKRFFNWKTKRESVNADIRNKLTPLKNLIAMLENCDVVYHEDPAVDKIIKDEIEQSKKSIDYLSKIN